MSSDIKPDSIDVVLTRAVSSVLDAFAVHAPDAPVADWRLRADIKAAIEGYADEMFLAGVEAVEIPPALDNADMKWLIARTMSVWNEDYYAAAWLVDLDVAIADAAAGRVMARSDAAHEARRLVRLVETLGIDWPTDADLETAPEGGEA